MIQDWENHIEQIRRRWQPLNPANLPDQIKSEDVVFLFETLDRLKQELETLRVKNNVLANQNLELAQEIENVKTDFGAEPFR